MTIVKSLKMLLIIIRWPAAGAAHGVHHAKAFALCGSAKLQIMLGYDVLPCFATSMQVEGVANVQNRLIACVSRWVGMDRV